jgi:hypothetical protein
MVSRRVRYTAAVMGCSAVAAAALVIEVHPEAWAGPDGGVCARLNGAPFYIPPQGYMPQPGEVITGPVHAGPCAESAPSQTPSLPQLPQPALPTSTSSSMTTPPPPAP